MRLRRRRRAPAAAQPRPAVVADALRFICVVVSIEAVSSIVLASCDDTLRIDDEGRWMLSRRMLRLEQAPHTNARAAPAVVPSIREAKGLVAEQAVLARAVVHPGSRGHLLDPASVVSLLCELSAAPRPEAVEAAQARRLDH